ncbi:MAG: UTP--glucose-1-phosphate uridylyltransferase [Planctomycetales bacterium]
MRRPPQELAATLAAHGQEHALRFWDQLDERQRRSLVAQLAALDLPLIDRLYRAQRVPAPAVESPAQRARRAEPPELVSLAELSAAAPRRREASRIGEELLAGGRIGVVLVAGGQGTRLGFPHPKGMFPIGPVSGATLFELLARQALARSRRAQAAIPYCVMTSDATHDDTVAFFEAHDHFGLPAEDVYFFRQGNMPAVDAETGRLLLAEKHSLCLSPDGHGGMLAALREAGLLDLLRQRGVEHLYYHQVDNPTAIVCDPQFLGLHALARSQLSTKVVAKKSPEERMGVVVRIDGRTEIIEYSDLPADVAAERNADGTLRIAAGNTAIHAFERAFLESLAGDGDELPFHVAHKKVPHLDDAGRPVDPAGPNAFKFERFIFDALPRAARALAVEADRGREFHPVKNASGDDSPDTARAALSRLHRGWLRAAGCRVPDDVPVEIDPLFALGAEELREKLPLGGTFDAPVRLA